MIARAELGPIWSGEWLYVVATIGAFVFAPEINRFSAWRGAYLPFNSFAIVPLVMLIPIGIIVWKRREHVTSSVVRVIALLWLGAFAYATLIAAAYGTLTQAIYGDAQFCLPLVVGLWLIISDAGIERTHARLGKVLILFATISAIYGIIQYILAPPWDAQWVELFGVGSFGTPEPFGIRVFGTLNSAGPFAFFLIVTILWNLPYLRSHAIATNAAMLIITVALFLTFLRSAWLGLLIGVLLFTVLSPRRGRALRSIASVAILAGLAFLVISLTAPTEVKTKIVERFNTLSDLQYDTSALTREESAGAALQAALDNPVGAGMGLTLSGSDQLSDPDESVFRGVPPSVIDNGFVSRFLEMGIPGFLGFLAACILAIVLAARAYSRTRKPHQELRQVIVASCVAILTVIFALNLSGDNQQGLNGLLFFAAVGIPLMPLAGAKPDNTRHAC